MVYQKSVCDLYVCGAAPEAWRINLEQGRFLKGIDTGLTEINCCDVNPSHELLAFGGIEPAVEFYDPRDRARLCHLNLADSLEKSADFQRLANIVRDAEVSSLRFDNDGLNFACGTSTGHVFLYDIRSSKPLMVKDHRYGLPIKDIRFHQKAGKILTADAKIMKLWDRKTFEPYTSIQPKCGINSTCIVENSGLIFAACEQPRVLSFYVPSLGPAPKWCAFLDSISEELEEDRGAQATVYDDYKFVTRDELTRLGLEHLIGSKLLRAYMHGYFMDMRLYKQVKSVTDPFEYENYIKERVQQKLEQEKSSRITVKRKVPKVNKEFATMLLKKQKKQQKGDAEQKQEEEEVVNPLGDDRFGQLFKDADFEIDLESEEYLRLHPAVNKKGSKGRVDDDRFDLVPERVERDSDDELVDDDSSSAAESSDDDDFLGLREAQAKVAPKPTPAPTQQKPKPQANKKPQMYQLRPGLDLPLKNKNNGGSSEDLSHLPLAERLKLLEQQKKSIVYEKETAVDKLMQNKKQRKSHQQNVKRGKKGFNKRK
jgi:ribosome biogenesis protein ENP2